MRLNKMTSVFLMMIAYWIIASCNQSKVMLTGKIVIQGNEDCTIFTDSEKGASFNIRNDKEVRYSGFTWLNGEDNFLGTEAVPGNDRNEYKSNIVKLDLSGKLLERIYEAVNGEIAWLGYPSKDDKYLLFTTHRLVDPDVYPFEELSPILSLNIMDLKQKKVIKIIDSIGRSPGFELRESPWLYDGNRFVYSISEGPKIMSEERTVNLDQNGPHGIYIYDVDSGSHKLLVPDGAFVIASPVGNQIGYFKDRFIQVLDLDTNKKRTIYELDSKDKVRDMHWTSDGKYIYIAYFEGGERNNVFAQEEKLIDVRMDKDVPFKKIGHGFTSYSWK